ncbi:MAG: hypothetical protein M3Q81_05715 [bacterium]|nr:hypothetical protein [bacterium]
MKKNFIIVALFIFWAWFVLGYLKVDKMAYEYSKEAVIAKDELEQLKASNRCNLDGWDATESAHPATPSATPLQK